MTDSTDAMLIAGEWRGAASGRTWDLIDPATEETLAQVPYGDSADARAALDAAAAAFPAWAAKTPYERGALLDKAADLIAARLDTYARRTT